METKIVKVYDITVRDERVPLYADNLRVYNHVEPFVREYDKGSYDELVTKEKVLPIKEFCYAHISEDKRHQVGTDSYTVDKHYLVVHNELEDIIRSEDRNRIEELLTEKIQWKLLPWYKRAWLALKGELVW